jgi:putative ABC transport system substrate-binding protein
MEPAEPATRASYPLERRTFMTLVSGGLLAVPLTAQAQQAGKVYSIGYLELGSSFAGPSRTAFYQGLQEHGWIEGQNFVLTTRFAQFKSERLRELVASRESQLTRHHHDIIH